jgi:hypothetical protein
MAFDKAVIRLLNVTLPFVCNKTAIPGWGVLADGRRQRAMEIAKIAEIAKNWQLRIKTKAPNPRQLGLNG